MRSGSNLSSQKPAPSSYDQWIEFARTATHGWHEEETKYPYDQPHYDDAWGHFTQMVWRNTSRVGCALGNCDAGQVDWPARFYCCELLASRRGDWKRRADARQTTTMSAIILQPASLRRRFGAPSAAILQSARCTLVPMRTSTGSESRLLKAVSSLSLNYSSPSPLDINIFRVDISGRVGRVDADILRSI
jgi:hypothetical protein